MTQIKIDDGNGDEEDLLSESKWMEHKLRKAMRICWMMLPDESRTTSRLADEMRRRLERAIRAYEEDERAFSS